MKIGLLALQGAFQKHAEKLIQLGVPSCEVRMPEHLADCDGLIIPGGESTTMHLLLERTGLWSAILDFAQQKPIFGTCAGTILMANDLSNDAMSTLACIDMTVERNAYGRQADSFIDSISVNLPDKVIEIDAVFIRAPMIKRIGPEVNVLAQHNGLPVIIQHGKHLAATFHPELTDNTELHQYFVTLLR